MVKQLHNEMALLMLVAQDDERAFEKIVHHYYSHLLAFVTKIVKQRHIAEEIVQEVFLRFWQQRAGFARMHNTGAWLFTVASNLSLTCIKRMAVEGRLLKLLEQQEPGYRPEAEERLYLKESHLLIYEAVSRLPPRQQAIYRLSRQQGLSIPEVARQLQLSPNTVKNHLVRALRFIRSFIRQETLLLLWLIKIF